MVVVVALESVVVTLLVTVPVFVFLSVPMSLSVLGTRTRFCSAQSPSAQQSETGTHHPQDPVSTAPVVSLGPA